MRLNPERIMDTLTLSSMKANYPEFVESKGYEGANLAMETVYGDAWIAHRNDIWQWFDEGETYYA